jgi:hypothetical protein
MQEKLENDVLGWIQEILELCSVMQMINCESYSSPECNGVKSFLQNYP